MILTYRDVQIDVARNAGRRWQAHFVCPASGEEVASPEEKSSLDAIAWARRSIAQRLKGPSHGRGSVAVVPERWMPAQRQMHERKLEEDKRAYEAWEEKSRRCMEANRKRRRPEREKLKETPAEVLIEERSRGVYS